MTFDPFRIWGDVSSGIQTRIGNDPLIMALVIIGISFILVFVFIVDSETQISSCFRCFAYLSILTIALMFFYHDSIDSKYRKLYEHEQIGVVSAQAMKPTEILQPQLAESMTEQVTENPPVEENKLPIENKPPGNI